LRTSDRGFTASAGVRPIVRDPRHPLRRADAPPRHTRNPPEHLAETIAFYELLGLRRVPTPAGIGDRAVWLERQGTQVHLMPRLGAVPASGHLALVLPDYGATLDRLRAAGHEIDPRREHWGAPRAYLRDPAGNLVEVMERPPPPECAP
jgi:catechol 2,3-dioxygenase-like lactoylglutathione lyase family enzyme